MDILLSVAFTFIEQISNNMDYYFIFLIICLSGKKKKNQNYNSFINNSVSLNNESRVSNEIG